MTHHTTCRWGLGREGVFGVVIGSDLAHIDCAVFHQKGPAQFTATGQSIYSHGGEKPVHVSRADKAVTGAQLAQMGGGGRANITVKGQALDAFIQAELEGGPGYLAAPGEQLLHQAGKASTLREVR